MKIDPNKPYPIYLVSQITKIPVHELENHIRLGCPSVYDVTSGNNDRLLKLSDLRFWLDVGRFINRGD